MRRILTCLLLLTLATTGELFLGQVTAHADTVCQRTDPQSGVCLIWVETDPAPSNPGDGDDPGPSDSGAGQACYWDGRPQNIFRAAPGPVPCSSEYGYWSNGYNCYISLLDPQPPAGDPAWKGHEPSDGAVYNCYQPQTDLLIYLWSQNPPPDSGAGPTPRDVAELAIDQMNLRAIDIGITPRPGDGSVGLVGMPVWMWAANPDNHSVGPITASASAGDITVTATARLHKITWDMGDGTKVTCTPYKAAYGNKKSPDCGHFYTKSSS